MHKESHNQLCRDIYRFKRATYLYTEQIHNPPTQKRAGFYTMISKKPEVWIQYKKFIPGFGGRKSKSQ